MQNKQLPTKSHVDLEDNFINYNTIWIYFM